MSETKHNSPPNWAVIRLGDLGPGRNESLNPRRAPDESFEVFSVPAFVSGTPEILCGATIGSNKQKVEAGAVLLCGINPRINRVWVVSEPNGRRQIASTEWIVFPPAPGMYSMYLRYFLQRNEVRDYLASNASGVGGSLMRVKGRVCAEITFPVAPCKEQARIVAEIEKQFTRLDTAVAALKRIQANLKRYRASVLKAACEGRLVPTEAELARAENRLYEPADKLLARILKERRTRWEAGQLAKMQAAGKLPKGDKWKAKYKEPAPPDKSNLPPLPEGWTWTTVDTLLMEPPCNGISVKGKDMPPGIPALKLNAMSERGFDYSCVRYLPLDRARVDDLWVRQGDFFVARGSGSLRLVGRGTLAQAPALDVIFPDTMIRLRATTPIAKTGWIPAIWGSILIRRQVEKLVKTTAGIYKISQPEVCSILVPLPPFAEQDRIVAEVERRLSVIDELETTVVANLKRAAGLRQSILKRAFEGKLVPQDPSDEPASALLERIRAKRTNKSRS